MNEQLEQRLIDVYVRLAKGDFSVVLSAG